MSDSKPNICYRCKEPKPVYNRRHWATLCKECIPLQIADSKRLIAEIDKTIDIMVLAKSLKAVGVRATKIEYSK